MEKVKILYFIDTMECGGIQQFVLEIIKKIDRNRCEIEILLLDDGNKYPLEEVLKKLDIAFYKLNGIWIKNLLDIKKQAKALDKFFCHHNDYKVVHLHSSSKNFMVLKYAQKYGIKVRVAHSHSIGFQTSNKLKIFAGNIFKKLLKKYATHYFACSKTAGEWLFGKTQTKIIRNGVDYNKFKIDEIKREEIRKELSIENKFVIGNVARFIKHKNHAFLIDIFNEIFKQNKNAFLMLVGVGEKEQQIRDKVASFGLEENVLFAKSNDNVNEYMWAMDCFVFPSLLEGLGIVLIEAQTSGLKCFASKDIVPDEAKVSDLLEYISLKRSAKEWADIILKSNFERKDIKEDLEKSGYLIEQTVNELQEFYINI